jgi:hypothetical protein
MEAVAEFQKSQPRRTVLGTGRNLVFKPYFLAVWD